MWCNKKGNQGHAGEKCPYDEFLLYNKSVCFHDNFYDWDKIFSRNFFLNSKCPNLVLDLNREELRECACKTIVAKLAAPLIIANRNSIIIDKDGNDTGINYIGIKPFLNFDGTVKESCKNDQQCKMYSAVMDKILWTSDKEVKLKISDNLGEKSSYSHSIGNNQDETFSYQDLIQRLNVTSFLDPLIQKR